MPAVVSPDRALPVVGVAILARAPVPGHAKTRLIPKLGAGGAARLQGWMLQRTVAMALAADIGPVSLWCEGDLEHPDVELCRSFGSVTVHPQTKGDLGERMLAAMQQRATEAGALVIGTDCPALGEAHLREAAHSLGTHDAVVIPAEDGGYVLLGMKRPSGKVFEQVGWGSERVMAQTRRRLAALGWQWSELASLWDVDRAADVERLMTIFPQLRERLRVPGEVV